jgi:hypothetical protein
MLATESTLAALRSGIVFNLTNSKVTLFAFKAHIPLKIVKFKQND